MSDALAHLDAAIAALCLEAYRGRDPESMSPVEHFTIGEDLKRIDSAIGPTGESVFARIADNIEAAYVELLAARALIAVGPSPEPRLNVKDHTKLDGPELWELTFGILEGDVPEQMTDEVFTKMAEAINNVFVDPLQLAGKFPSPETRVQAPEDFEEKLSDFLEALDEWGCDDNAERAREILEFQRTGYDLDAYLVEHPGRPKSELN